MKPSLVYVLLFYLDTGNSFTSEAYIKFEVDLFS